MTLETLKYELSRRKILLELDGTKVVALDPYSRLSPRLDAALRQHKKALAAELETEKGSANGLKKAIAAALVQTDLHAIPERIEAAFDRGTITREEAESLAQLAVDTARKLPADINKMSLSVFARSGQIRKVRSKVLGETIVWAADNAALPEENALVVYRAHELKALVGLDPQALVAVHTTKKWLDGIIEPPEKSSNQLAKDKEEKHGQDTE